MILEIISDVLNLASILKYLFIKLVYVEKLSLLQKNYFDNFFFRYKLKLTSNIVTLNFVCRVMLKSYTKIEIYLFALATVASQQINSVAA